MFHGDQIRSKGKWNISSADSVKGIQVGTVIAKPDSKLYFPPMTILLNWKFQMMLTTTQNFAKTNYQALSKVESEI